MNSQRYGTTGRVLTAAVAALAAMLLWSTGPAAAQQGSVSGQVVDASNLQPVVGAQVFFPELDAGTLTNEEGRYRITGIPAGQHQIRVRLLGYRPATRNVTIQAGETTTLDFQLNVSAVSLGEVVVTASGEQRTRELGNAISTIDAAETVDKSQASTFSNLIQGQSSGVTVRQSSGSVGSGSTINIRGITSIGQDNTPLIYIDGARVSNTNSAVPQGDFFAGGQETSRLNDLNPESIESIEIIKGPAAATLYGTEAAAGVIRITTKQGSSGEARYNFWGQSMWNSDATSWPGVAYNANPSPAPAVGTGSTQPLPGAKDTTYIMNLLEGNNRVGQADPFRTGFGQNFGGSVRGGVDAVQYYVSADYRQEEGNLPSNDITRWNARANATIDAGDNVELNISNGFTSSGAALPENDNNGNGFIGNSLLGVNFFAPMRRSDPVSGGPALDTCPLAFEATRAGLGPALGLPNSDLATTSLICGRPQLSFAFDDIGLFQNDQDIERYTGSGTLTYRPWDFLTNRVTVGYDEFAQRTEEIVPVVPRLQSVNSDFNGLVQIYNQTSKNVTLEGTSSLSLPVTDNLQSTTTVGVQYNSENTRGNESLGRQFPAGSPTVGNSVTQEAGDFNVESRTLGLFVEEQIAFKDRLFITPAVRFDDNSAAGAELDTQVLPRVSGSYVISDEDWFPQFFEQFRLRGAWGVSGVQPGTNDALAILAGVSTPVGGDEQLGVAPAQPANPTLSPARSEEWEGGFDASVLNGRLGLEATYYYQKTEDDIIASDLAPSGGFPGEQFTNIGEIESQGVELSLDATAISMADFTWDWRVNFSTNSGEITQLDNPIIFGLGGASQRHAEGLPFAAYVTEPVSVDGAGNVVVGDEQIVGQPTPEWNGSVSTTMSLFQSVTLYALMDFSGGHQLFNATEEFMATFAVSRPPTIHQTDAQGNPTNEARVKQVAGSVASQDPWIEDASNARLRTVSLGFDLPQNWVEFMGARSVNVRLVGENLATFTGYSGLDPELNGAGQADASRFDFLTLPPARRFLTRVSLSF